MQCCNNEGNIGAPYLCTSSLWGTLSVTVSLNVQILTVAVHYRHLSHIVQKECYIQYQNICGRQTIPIFDHHIGQFGCAVWFNETLYLISNQTGAIEK